MSKTETQSDAQILASFYEKYSDNVSTSTAEALRRLDAENKALRADAERYRWLRVQPDDCSAPRIDICHWTCEPGDSVNNGEGLRGDAADQAIDAARAAAKTGDAAPEIGCKRTGSDGNGCGEIDRERMEKALASKSFTLPNGLSQGEIVDHFTRAAKEQA